MTFTVPADGATGAAIDASVVAVFSEAMDPASIDAASFTLLQGGTTIPGVVTSMGATAMLDPTVSLALDTEYEATITVAATDLARNRLAATYAWIFRTGAGSNHARPSPVLFINGPAGMTYSAGTSGSIRVAKSTRSSPRDP